MKFAIVFLALFLAGCVNPAVKEVGNWAAVEKPRAERGEIKWSVYYKEFFSRIEKLPNIAGKAENMEWANLLIQAAQLYEAGTMSKDQFENMQRIARVEMQKTEQAQSAAAARAFGQAMQAYGNARYGPEERERSRYPSLQSRLSAILTGIK